MSRSAEQQAPLSSETQRLVEHLGRDGYAVYKTSGKTPASLREEGMKYWYLNPGLANLTAEPALLAFKKDPSEFYLRGSYHIPYEDQIRLIPEEQRKVDKKYPDAGLIVRVGHFPEWPELALKHFKAAGVRIHGKDFGYNYTWTDTYGNNKQGAYRALAGCWDGANGFNGNFWGSGSVSPRLRLAHLVVIPRK
ncbi:MAG: hypothetical protein AAB609_02110 [Patescibacteria group bacterium]|mgnify:FL=1